MSPPESRERGGEGKEGTIGGVALEQTELPLHLLTREVALHSLSAGKRLRDFLTNALDNFSPHVFGAVWPSFYNILTRILFHYLINSTKRQNDKKANQKKRQNGQKDKDQKREFNFVMPGQFCSIGIFLMVSSLVNSSFK